MNITVYTKSGCVNCDRAKQLLKSKGLEYTEQDFEQMSDGQREEWTAHYPGVRQMPQIFISGQRVGGLAGLQAALKQLGV